MNVQAAERGRWDVSTELSEKWSGASKYSSVGGESESISMASDGKFDGVIEEADGIVADAGGERVAFDEMFDETEDIVQMLFSKLDHCCL